jgi:L-amino acid N-acyltransferase YncA
MPLIRPATLDDIKDITPIYQEAVQYGTASWELEPPDVSEMTRRFTALTEAGYPYIVAENEDSIKGYAYAGSYRPRAAYRFTVENSIYVATDAHGHGIGRALMSSLIEACTAAGFRQMMAVIGDSSNAASIALHRSAGFEPVGIARAVGFKHGRWLDQVMMQRVLGSGSDTAPV